MKKYEVTILAPAFNEEENLKEFIEHFLSRINKNWSMLVVNDGSQDGSENVLKHYGDIYQNFHYINHYKNLGLGKAFETGFRSIKSDYVVTIDADMSHDINMVELLYQNREKADVVLASIFEEGSKFKGTSKLRLFISRTGNRLISKILGFRVKEVAGGPRIYKTKFLKGIELKNHGFESQIEILLFAKKKGATFSEIPIILGNRKYGKSKMNYLKMAIGILKVIKDS